MHNYVEYEVVPAADTYVVYEVVPAADTYAVYEVVPAADTYVVYEVVPAANAYVVYGVVPAAEAYVVYEVVFPLTTPLHVLSAFKISMQLQNTELSTETLDKGDVMSTKTILGVNEVLFWYMMT